MASAVFGGTQPYFGTKRIDAWPEDRNGVGGMGVRYPDGYESWSPLDVFADAYQPVSALSFGHALVAVKSGYRIARSDWNGKGAFVAYMPPLHLPPFNSQHPGQKVNDRTAKWIGKDQPLDCQPYLAMYTADKKWVPGWLASQTDMLANDWYILDEVAALPAKEIEVAHAAAAQPEQAEAVAPAGSLTGRPLPGSEPVQASEGVQDEPPEMVSAKSDAPQLAAEKAVPEPSIGRIVHVRSQFPDHLGADVEYAAAIITNVRSGSLNVDLHVIRNCDSPIYLPGVPYSENRVADGYAAAWSWPPRV